MRILAGPGEGIIPGMACRLPRPRTTWVSLGAGTPNARPHGRAEPGYAGDGRDGAFLRNRLVRLLSVDALVCPAEGTEPPLDALDELKGEAFLSGPGPSADKTPRAYLCHHQVTPADRTVSHRASLLSFHSPGTGKIRGVSERPPPARTSRAPSLHPGSVPRQAARWSGYPASSSSRRARSG
jgi:hypothetical protein